MILRLDEVQAVKKDLAFIDEIITKRFVKKVLFALFFYSFYIAINVIYFDSLDMFISRLSLGVSVAFMFILKHYAHNVWTNKQYNSMESKISKKSLAWVLKYLHQKNINVTDANIKEASRYLLKMVEDKETAREIDNARIKSEFNLAK